MTRSFIDQPLAAGVVDELLDLARRGPSAGFTQGVEFLVLDQPERLWAVSLPEPRRADFPWPGLLRAPVVVLVLADESRYRRRYGERDKAASGLAGGEWPVPYWYVDAAFAAQILLLAAEDRGLGALFFGLFEHERAVLESLGVPSGIRAVGAVALGHRDPDDRPSGSANRGRRPLSSVVHRGRW